MSRATSLVSVAQQLAVSTGVAAGTPEFFKARETYVAARLDGRINKPIVPEPEPEPIQQPRGPFARSARPKQV